MVKKSSAANNNFWITATAHEKGEREGATRAGFCSNASVFQFFIYSLHVLASKMVRLNQRRLCFHFIRFCNIAQNIFAGTNRNFNFLWYWNSARRVLCEQYAYIHHVSCRTCANDAQTHTLGCRVLAVRTAKIARWAFFLVNSGEFMRFSVISGGFYARLTSNKTYITHALRAEKKNGQSTEWLWEVKRGRNESSRLLRRKRLKTDTWNIRVKSFRK